jgi:hypothetical protein
MTNTATLTGITSEQGQCDACGRELGRVFSVRYQNGTEGTLGRRCAAKATGWAVGAVEREANRTAWLAARDEKRASHRAELVAQGHGDKLAWLEAHAAPINGYANNAMVVLWDILDGADHLLSQEVRV